MKMPAEQLVRGMSVLLALSTCRPVLGQNVDAPASRESASGSEAESVVITARKRDELIGNVPESITSFSAQTISDYDIRTFADYASKTPNLSFAYGNGTTAGDPATAIGNARTIAIRGVAGARTSGFYVDDTPLPGAVDVRVVDLQDIEVLKGPQGTLFGESSLGGNVRLITTPPNLSKDDLRVMAVAGHTQAGGAPFNGELEAAGNVVLSPGALALRIVGFRDDSAGYLTRTYLSNIDDANSPRIAVANQGSQRAEGGSISGLARVSHDLDVTLRLMYQNTDDSGFPAAYAPLPAFTPIDTLDHVANIQPLVADRWLLPSVSIVWRGEGWTLSSSTSRFARDILDVEDSTEGTAQFWGTVVPQGFAWTARHTIRQLSHETRVSFDAVGKLSGTAGLFYARNDGVFSIDPLYGLLGPAPGTNSLLWVERDASVQADAAVFGELYYRLTDKATLTLGDRHYWTRQSDSTGFSFLDTNFASQNHGTQQGDSPKLALSYQASAQALAYASAAQGFRSGGSQFNPDGLGCDASLAAIGQTGQSITQIKPDTVTSYEVGAKLDLPDPGLLLSAALFRIDWNHIQQPLFLGSCGFYLLGNAGAARINGAEFELNGRVSPALKIRLGIGYEDGRITKQGVTAQAVGSRIYQTPEWTATAGGVYTKPIGDMAKWFVAADYSYTGNSVSANTVPGLQLVRPGYSLVNLRAGIDWGKSELALALHNACNSRPNLGDIGYIGYNRWANPPTDTIPMPQVATLPPRTIVLQFRQRF